MTDGSLVAMQNNFAGGFSLARSGGRSVGYSGTYSPSIGYVPVRVDVKQLSLPAYRPLGLPTLSPLQLSTPTLSQQSGESWIAAAGSSRAVLIGGAVVAALGGLMVWRWVKKRRKGAI